MNMKQNLSLFLCQVTAEEKSSNLEMALNKKDANATVMRERINLLTTQLKDVETALSVSEGALKLADDKVEGMKV